MHKPEVIGSPSNTYLLQPLGISYGIPYIFFYCFVLNKGKELTVFDFLGKFLNLKMQWMGEQTHTHANTYKLEKMAPTMLNNGFYVLQF